MFEISFFVYICGMKAKELRIGNITDKGIVKSFYEHGVHVGFGKCFKFNELSSVPLTEEWLVKFGFEKMNECFYKDRFFVEKGISEFFDYGMSFRIVVNQKESTHANSIKYVHQLQNLYFALTGSELTQQPQLPTQY